MKSNMMKKSILLFLVHSANAQTAPVTPQPMPKIEHVSGNNYSFTWEGLPNRVYFMQVSSQVSSENGFLWEYVPDIRTGTGQLLSMGFEANAESSEFFRLVYVDYFGPGDPNILDFDGDGFTNLEEAFKNTSSFDASDIPNYSGNSQNGGNSGSGNSGSNNPSPQLSLWEYDIIKSVDSAITPYTFNSENDQFSFGYSMGEDVVTNLHFVDVKGENSASFLRMDPNEDYDPSDPENEEPEFNIIEVITLSASNPSWNYTAPSPTGPQGMLVPVEFCSDIDNDGNINPLDSALRDKAFQPGATDFEVNKGTEFIFENDLLSNGAWDGQGTASHAVAGLQWDDDAEEIKIVPGISEGKVWLEHPKIDKISFYRNKFCKPESEIPLHPNNPYLLSESNPFPKHVFMRVDEPITFPNDNPQFEGDIILKVKQPGQNKPEVIISKIKLTIVESFGAEKYFFAARDYIMEENTKYFIHDKFYGANCHYRLVSMREESTNMALSDTYDHVKDEAKAQFAGIPKAQWIYHGATLVINGNQCFFSGLPFPGAMTDRCDGRFVVPLLGALIPPSDDNHHPLGGPDFGRWVGVKKNHGLENGELVRKNTFHLEKGQAPVAGDWRFHPSMGGLSTNYGLPVRQVAENQAIGYAPVLEEGKGLLFTATNFPGKGGKALELSVDAKKSGVPLLPGQDPADNHLMLAFLDGSTSVGLCLDNPFSDDRMVVIAGDKHVPGQGGMTSYYVNTYISFLGLRPRPWR